MLESLTRKPDPFFVLDDDAEVRVCLRELQLSPAALEERALAFARAGATDKQSGAILFFGDHSRTSHWLVFGCYAGYPAAHGNGWMLVGLRREHFTAGEAMAFIGWKLGLDLGGVSWIDTASLRDQ